jgi:hypothetical protein
MGSKCWQNQGLRRPPGNNLPASSLDFCIGVAENWLTACAYGLPPPKASSLAGVAAHDGHCRGGTLAGGRGGGELSAGDDCRAAVLLRIVDRWDRIVDRWDQRSRDLSVPCLAGPARSARANVARARSDGATAEVATTSSRLRAGCDPRLPARSDDSLAAHAASLSPEFSSSPALQLAILTAPVR